MVCSFSIEFFLLIEFSKRFRSFFFMLNIVKSVDYVDSLKLFYSLLILLLLVVKLLSTFFQSCHIWFYSLKLSEVCH